MNWGHLAFIILAIICHFDLMGTKYYSDLPRGVRRRGGLGAHVQVDGEPLGREVRPRRRLLQGRLLSRLNIRPPEMIIEERVADLMRNKIQGYKLL